MNGWVDADGTEYAAGRVETRGLEGFMSLARFLGVTVGTVLDLRDRNQLAGAIQKRNAEKADAEKRAAGYVTCRRCSGQVQQGLTCGCGEREPGRRTLTGIEAAAITRRRYLVPL